jgi:hypothetical protein
MCRNFAGPVPLIMVLCLPRGGHYFTPQDGGGVLQQDFEAAVASNRQ